MDGPRLPVTVSPDPAQMSDGDCAIFPFAKVNVEGSSPFAAQKKVQSKRSVGEATPTGRFSFCPRPQSGPQFW